ncbi:unnamed protein product, partial [Urochloa humidicola]
PSYSSASVPLPPLFAPHWICEELRRREVLWRRTVRSGGPGEGRRRLDLVGARRRPEQRPELGLYGLVVNSDVWC